MIRRWLFTLCFGLTVAGLAPRLCAGQNAPQAVANQPAQTQAPAPQAAQPEAYTLPPDKLAKAIALGRIRSVLHFAYALWDLAILWLVLASGTAASLSAWTERMTRRRWLQGLVFFGVLLVFLTVADLPLDWYSQHVSRGYGISVQGWGSWVLDLAKALGLSVLIGAPVMLMFNWIVRRWPRRYWLYAWMVSLPLMVMGTFASPLLEPVFNKFEPLAGHHPELVAQLEKVVARTGTQIPPDRMYLMKASLKTNGLNAYVSGLGATKRVVVWDTTAGRIPNDEVLFIFGHESGHYVLRHIPQGLAASAIGSFFVFWACAGFAGWLVRRFGAGWRVGSVSTRGGFVVLLFTISLAGLLLEPVVNAYSRHIEHEADIYGQEAIHGIVADPQKTAVAAFNHLGEAWLEDPNPSPFIEFWTYSHPSVQQRADFAEHYDPWVNGGRGRFFAH